MTKLKVPFYVSTNNKHLECLEVFIHIFNHFIPEQELRILGMTNHHMNCLIIVNLFQWVSKEMFQSGQQTYGNIS